MDGLTDQNNLDARLDAHFDTNIDNLKVIDPNTAVDGAVSIPKGADFLSADFVREGYDLILDGGSDVGLILIPDYFSSDTPPDLSLGDAGVINSDLASKLAGPMVSGDHVAQINIPAVTTETLGESIGSVSELEGSVSATRADGTQVTLGVGDPIFQGDVIETADDGSVGLVFADDTLFSLEAGGRMVMDEMVYDPDSQTGVFETTVVKGVFSFVSGQTAKTDPDAMVISTPKTTIGIRGTSGIGKTGVEEDQSAQGDVVTAFASANVGGGSTQLAQAPGGPGDSFVLIPDPGSNFVGEAVVGGKTVNTAFGSVDIGPGGFVSDPIQISPAQVLSNYGGAMVNLSSIANTHAQNKTVQAERKAREAQDQAAQQQQEAQQVEEEAQQADAEAAEAEAAAAAAEAEAEAARAEAEALKAAAEAEQDAAAKAAAEQAAAEAEAAAAEAEAQAQAEAQAAEQKAQEAEVLQAEVETKVQQAQQAEQEAQQAVQQQAEAQSFQAAVTRDVEIKQQMLTQFEQTGQIDPELQQQFMEPSAPLDDQALGNQPQDGPQDGAEPSNPDNPENTAQVQVEEDSNLGPDAGDLAADDAFVEAVSKGATAEEAFEAAAKAAMEAGGQEYDPNDPTVQAARAAYEEALANGATGDQALDAAKQAVAQYDFEQQQQALENNTAPVQQTDPTGLQSGSQSPDGGTGSDGNLIAATGTNDTGQNSGIGAPPPPSAELLSTSSPEPYVYDPVKSNLQNFEAFASGSGFDTTSSQFFEAFEELQKATSNGDSFIVALEKTGQTFGFIANVQPPSGDNNLNNNDNNDDDIASNGENTKEEGTDQGSADETVGDNTTSDNDKEPQLVANAENQPQEASGNTPAGAEAQFAEQAELSGTVAVDPNAPTPAGGVNDGGLFNGGSFDGRPVGEGMIIIGPSGLAITITDTTEIIIGQGGQAVTGDIKTTLQTHQAVVSAYYENDHQDIQLGPEGHFDEDHHFDPLFAPLFDPLFDPLLDHFFEHDPLEDPEFVEVDFAQTFAMPDGGGIFNGGTAPTNYYFAWQHLKSGTGGHYSINDDTAAVNQISLDGMVDVRFKVVASTATSGHIDVFKDYSGSTQLSTVNYSGISQFLLSNVVVSSLAGNSFAQDEGGDILKLSGLNAGEIGYGIAATHSNDSISVTFGNAIVFGNDGDDTFNVTAPSGGGKLLGGNGADTFNMDTFASDWDLIGGTDTSADVFDYATLTSSVYAYFRNTSKTVQDNSESSGNVNIRQNLGIDSHDTFIGTSVTDYIHVFGGSYGTISGDDGDDVFQVSAEMFSSSAFTSLDGGSMSSGDSMTVLVSNSTAFDLSSYSAMFSNMNSVTISGSSSPSSGIHVTGQASIGTTFHGSGYADTMIGGSGADMFQGNTGGDTITSGNGNDVFKYNASTEGMDLLQDFTSGTDKFHFATSGFFGANNAGVLDTVHFVSGAGASAGDANDYFIYDTSSKILYYDADGSGSGNSQIAIAKLEGSSDTVVAGDIVMV